MNEENKVTEVTQNSEVPSVGTSTVPQQNTSIQSHTNNRNNKIPIIILVIAVLLIGAGACLLLGNDSKEEKKDLGKEEVVDKKDEDSNVFKDITNDLDNVYVNNEKVNFIFHTNHDSTGDHDDLYVNDIMVVKTGKLGPKVGKIYQTNDGYFIVTVLGDNDLRNTHIYVFDSNVKNIVDIYEYEKSMVIFADSEIVVNDNVITVTASRYGDGQSIILEDGKEVQLLNCTDEVKKLKVDDNYVVKAKYQLTYQGQGNFIIEQKEVLETYKTLLDKNCK